jgi:Thioredoxin domain
VDPHSVCQLTESTKPAGCAYSVSDITDTRRRRRYAVGVMPDAPTAPTRSEIKRPAPDQPKVDLKKAPRLEVYVSSECLNCGEAVRLAEEAAERYPNVVVRVIDLDQLDGNPPPDPVVAVPTYLLNGRVVSLGNPYPEELFARLHEAVE